AGGSVPVSAVVHAASAMGSGGSAG
ncbi:MAG: hypothetical protein JWR64_2249, partial [Marmoricola sp.]|nr:hypothetical protein [Marmoricola sp.]